MAPRPGLEPGTCGLTERFTLVIAFPRISEFIRVLQRVTTLASTHIHGIARLKQSLGRSIQMLMRPSYRSNDRLEEVGGGVFTECGFDPRGCDAIHRRTAEFLAAKTKTDSLFFHKFHRATRDLAEIHISQTLSLLPHL